MTIFAAGPEDAKAIAEIVSLSNKDVAVTFGITKENNPKHPSFYDEAWALADFERGEEYFLFKLDGENAGCVAFEMPNPDVGYLNRLSVLPAYRKRGVGAALVRHVFSYAKSKGVPEISIGIIAENTDLMNWYKKLGFVENGLKKFSHLPFDVLFMKYDLVS
jgi:ribosomal protein S18 acetylase RimI-like enzyme